MALIYKPNSHLLVSEPSISWSSELSRLFCYRGVKGQGIAWVFELSDNKLPIVYSSYLGLTLTMATEETVQYLETVFIGKPWKVKCKRLLIRVVWSERACLVPKLFQWIPKLFQWNCRNATNHYPGQVWAPIAPFKNWILQLTHHPRPEIRIVSKRKPLTGNHNFSPNVLVICSCTLMPVASHL